MKTTKQTNRRQKHKGIAILWVAFLLIIFIGFVGFVIDAARIYLAGHQLHNASDAAALAGARYVPMVMVNGSTDEAEQVAQDFAKENDAARLAVHLDKGWTLPEDSYISLAADDSISPYAVTEDIVIGRYISSNRLLIVDHNTPDSMLVVGRRDGTDSKPKLPLLFGPIFGVDTADLKKYAIAKVRNPYGAGMLALGDNPNRPGIEFLGKGNEDALTIFGGGSLYVNSSWNPGGQEGAIDATGNADPVVNFDRMYVVGGIDSKMDFPPDTDIEDYRDGVEPEPDPYAGVFDDLPAYDPNNDLGTITAGGAYPPGYYSGGIDKPDGPVILETGGVYHLGGVGIDAKKAGTFIQGENVLLHIVGSGAVTLNGGTAEISGHSDYADVAIFQDNSNNSLIIGNNDLNIDGAIYMPNSLLELGGTGGGLGTRMVADRYQIQGNSKVVINYKGEPKIAPKSYLVE